MAPSLVLVLVGAGLAAVAGFAALLLGRRPVPAHRTAVLLSVLGALVGAAGALRALLADGGGSWTAAWPMPAASLALHLDGLAALFLLPVFVVTGLAAVYGLGYEPPQRHHGRAVRPFLGLLTAGLVLLLLARNGVLFLVGWETMALSAFFLIATDHRQAGPRQAAWIYLVVTHLGTLCLIAAFALLQQPDGSLDWRADAIAALPPARAVAVFGLGLLGFGLKAGLMPMHVWLPGAHGNAPSHVSAVLSGVVIKMGAYGLLRLQSLLPPLPVAAGAVLLLLAALTALLGIAAALGQRDLKRMLAYSSIENLGIVGIGIGMAGLGRSLGLPELQALGLCGALLHVLAHSLFKPLLFLAAGAVLHATGTRQMDQHGGLLVRMPRTGSCFLVGAAAICGLPLLNGFAGELALYLGLLQMATAAAAGLALLGAAALTALAMVGGLALLTFVRSSAAVWLGRPRSAAAATAHEVAPSMTVPLLLLALACLLLGLLPQALLPLLGPAVTAAAGGAPGLTAPAALLPLATLSWLAIGCAALLFVLLVWLRARAARGPAAPPVGTWDCGYPDATAPRLQYTASSFAQFSVQLLRWTVRERQAVPARLELFPGPRAFSRRTRETLLHGVFWPLCRRLADRCSRLRFLQRGNLQIYLLYILVVLVLLLAWSGAATWIRS